MGVERPLDYGKPTGHHAFKGNSLPAANCKERLRWGGAQSSSAIHVRMLIGLNLFRQLQLLTTLCLYGIHFVLMELPRINIILCFIGKIK